MSDLKVDKHTAIDILKKRIADLDGFQIDDKVWCSRTSQDLKSIFQGLPGITRSHEIELLKYAPAGSWKRVGRGYLNTYIDFINDYFPDEVARKSDVLENTLLQTKHNLTLQTEANLKLDRHLHNAQSTIAELKGQIELLESDDRLKDLEINRLNDSIWQIEGVNLKRLWNVFSNLKLGEQIIIIGALIAIFSAGFWVGTVFIKYSLVSK